ncbi:hypothetical protein J2787_002846 [Chryseobacterium rhizosphaerae]|uniref:Uncharacterized protein n=1 Tax=Chryseobacterium rhizosphaerae TaxID=395937 RepID=A0AAE3Y9H4_9FLAO|nr:hypothetical protein [Chryseobacterium rhizosphaerae]
MIFSLNINTVRKINILTPHIFIYLYTLKHSIMGTLDFIGH